MPRKASQRALYLRRKLEGKCVHCGATLQDDDGDRCVECTAQTKRWRASEAGKQSHARSMKRWRIAAIAIGRCLDCPAPAKPGRRCCVEHLAARAAVQRDHRRAA